MRGGVDNHVSRDRSKHGFVRLLISLNRNVNPIVRKRILGNQLTKLILILILFQFFANDVLAEAIRVGVILPLSGDTAAWGEGVKNGINMAYDELNEADRAEIKLYFEDDNGSPMRSVAAFNKLVAANNIDVVIAISSGPTKAIAPLAEERRIPFLSMSTDQSITLNRHYVMSLYISSESQAGKIVEEIERRDYKTIAQIVSEQDGYLAVKKIFDKTKPTSLNIVIDELYSPDIKDFRPFLNKLRTYNNIDAIYVQLLPGQAGIFAKQARAYGIKVPLFGHSSFENKNEVILSGGALIGQWYVTSSAPDQVFTDKYKKLFPQAASWSAANGYDAIKLISKASKQHSDREGVNNFLHNVSNYSGALGTYSSIRHGRYNLPASVKIVSKDGFEEVKH